MYSINASNSGIGAGIIVKHDDRVLLVQINYGRAIGKWILPGGTVDKGEHPEQAAERELFEETGLKGTATGLLAVRHRLQPEHKQDANVYFVFKGELNKEEQINPDSRLIWDPEELQSVKFWSQHDIDASSEVAPTTKLFIEKMNNSSILAEKHANPNAGIYTDSIYSL